MKRNLIKIAVSIAAAVLCAAIFTFAVAAERMQNRFDNELYGNVVRLHILANSDSTADQTAKFNIRDGILEYTDELVRNACCANEAAEIISSNLVNIEKYARTVSENLGYNYDVSVEFSEEYYPVRYYDSFSFPAGKYKSLKIILGSGAGKNWWCVLYPSVCTSMASEAKSELERAGVSKSTTEVLCSDKTGVKFGLYLLEMFVKK